MKNEKIKKFFSGKTFKGIAVASAALLIGLAVYLNYRWFYDPASSLGFGDNNMDDSYGDSASTGGDASSENNYFTATALDRKEARDEAIDVLKLVTENAEATAEARAEAAEKISKIAVDIQNEASIETLVKAKGFEECVAVISDGSASIVVRSDGLQPAQISQINEIVYEQAGIKPVNITIIER